MDKEVGDSVFCGTINRFGSIDIRATKVGEDSSLQKLIRMVQDAENKKALMAYCIAFDKTGTLTYGNLVVSDVVSFDPAISENELLRLTASVETLSEHPLAKAIVTHAKEQNAAMETVTNFT